MAIRAKPLFFRGTGRGIRLLVSREMKAAYINRTGGPEVIEFGELPVPEPTPAQCLIKVAAVDVNPIDVYVRSGMIPVKLSFPHILGRDLAGTIVRTGAAVKQ